MQLTLEQKAKLLESEVVLRYLGLLGDAQESEEPAPVLAVKDDDVEDDFS